MAEYDFEYDLEKEKLALEKDYLKASHRYEKIRRKRFKKQNN